MVQKEYSHLIKPMVIKEPPAGLYPESRVWMEAKDLEGFNAHFSYGFIKEPKKIHPIEGALIHPFDECLVFEGTDNTNIRYLGAEISVELGDERSTASWCLPCYQEASELEQAWRDYKDRGVQFYGIAYKDAKSKAQGFLEEFGITYPCAMDPENLWSRRYGVTGIPETVILDQQGQLVEHIVGPTSAADLGRILDQLVDP